MPSAVCYHLSLSTDGHCGPDEIMLQEFKQSQLKKAKESGQGQTEKRKRRQENKTKWELIQKNILLSNLL